MLEIVSLELIELKDVVSESGTVLCNDDVPIGVL